MFDEDKARKELEARQELRREAKLPLIDIEAELAILREQKQDLEYVCDFIDWKNSNPELVQTIKYEVLNELRREWNKPADWVPSGTLSGGELWYGLQIQTRLQQVFKMR